MSKRQRAVIGLIFIRGTVICNFFRKLIFAIQFWIGKKLKEYLKKALFYILVVSS
jgi:hypothetical protein